MESTESSRSLTPESASKVIAVESGHHFAEPSRLPLRTPRLYRLLDGFTEAVLYFMVIFSPWAFGTTQRWSTWVMNVAGYMLGGLLVAKWLIRWRTGYQPSRWSGTSKGTRRSEFGSESMVKETGTKTHQFFTATLAVLTVLILAYCLISAINARVRYYHQDGQRFFTYLDCINWLPHSYDQRSTWFAFWSYLALAFSFWAIRDWLLGKTSQERRADREDSSNEPPADRRTQSLFLPTRLQRLLWVLCINGAVLGLEGILQRLDGSGKLLWLVKPHIIQTADAQFGPYAYRSNAAQYFNLLWPVCLGFWWTLRKIEGRSLRRAARMGEGSHVLLLPCAILMAACPIISTSRGGAIIAAAGLLLVFAILIIANRSGHWQARLGILVLFSVMVGFAGYLGWDKLEDRLKTIFNDDLSGRTEIYENTRKIANDFPLLGTGPNSFVAVYRLYRTNPTQIWQAYVHDDWLETRVTFGRIGFGLILLAMSLIVLHGFWPSERLLPWLFTAMVWVGLAGCLLHARFDFPFQVYSILFLFMVQSAIVSGLARRQ